MTFNPYGDSMRDTTGSHGADIAAQRMDDLDKAALAHILQGGLPAGVALDLGSGTGYHALRMAALGQRVIAVDLMDMTVQFQAVTAAFPELQLCHICACIQDFAAPGNRQPLSLLYSQRTLHYLTFSESTRALRELSGWMATGARAFLSFSGLDSELGDGYAHVDRPAADRWHRLAPAMAEKHGILEPVCLYRASDLSELARATGLSPVKIWVSEFGNIKGILEKT